jgi:hypothetical protein
MNGRRVVLSGLLLLAAGCAHRPMTVGAPEIGRTETRYRAALAAREAATAGTALEISLWLATAASRYPGVRGTARLGGDEAVRLVIDSAFGVGLDAAALADSVFAYAPSRRAAVRMRDSDPPLGFSGVSRLAVRALAATWSVPAQAWRGAVAVDSLQRVRYMDRGDTIDVDVAASGWPREVRIRRPGMRPVRVAYLAYAGGRDAAWPVRMEIEDTGGAFRLSLRVRRISDVPPSGRDLRPDIPMGAALVEPGDLMRWIESE